MPNSTPFGYTEMYIFYDAATKVIAVYFGKSTTSAEMLSVFRQFLVDFGKWLPNGRVEEWYTDGGPEFSGECLEAFCREIATRRRFIAPWNPWMNVSETGWRVILRPLRIILAASNVSRRLWPFAVAAIVRIHNALSSASSTIEPENLLSAFLSSLSSAKSPSPPPSPWFAMTGEASDLSHVRVFFF